MTDKSATAVYYSPKKPWKNKLFSQGNYKPDCFVACVYNKFKFYQLIWIRPKSSGSGLTNLANLEDRS